MSTKREEELNNTREQTKQKTKKNKKFLYLEAADITLETNTRIPLQRRIRQILARHLSGMT